MTRQLFFDDARGNTYSAEEMFGLYTIRDCDGGLVNYGLSLDVIVGDALGQTALDSLMSAIEDEQKENSYGN
jgi:hypothetical protein